MSEDADSPEAEEVWTDRDGALEALILEGLEPHAAPAGEPAAPHVRTEDSAEIDALLLDRLYREEHGLPLDDPRPTVGILETVLLHQIGTTALLLAGLTLMGPPGGGWAIFPQRLAAEPLMAALLLGMGLLGMGSFVGTLVAGLALFVTERTRLKHGWIGSPPLVWAAPVTAASLVIATATLWGLLQVF